MGKTTEVVTWGEIDGLGRGDESYTLLVLKQGDDFGLSVLSWHKHFMGMRIGGPRGDQIERCLQENRDVVEWFDSREELLDYMYGERSGTRWQFATGAHPQSYDLGRFLADCREVLSPDDPPSRRAVS